MSSIHLSKEQVQRAYYTHLKQLEQRDNIDFKTLQDQVKAAKWYIVDNASKNDAKYYIGQGKYEIVRKLLEINPELLRRCDSGLTVDQFMTKMKEKHHTVHVSGGILLDDSFTKILLSQCSSSKKFNFPKGGLNKGETMLDGMKRHVINRTGYIIHNQDDIITSDPLKIIVEGTNRSADLYVVKNVPLNGVFNPAYYNAVLEVKFFHLDQIERQNCLGVVFSESVLRHIDEIKQYCFTLKSK